jgi:diguanylate cyclase (GGDEF)-like protein/PAS domain S-box-containing protein
MSEQHAGQFDRAWLDALSEGFAVVDADGTVAWCNQSGCDILGLTTDAATGRIISDDAFGCVDEHGRALTHAELPAAIALIEDRPVVDFTLGVVTPTGERRWLSVNAQVTDRTTDDRPARVITTFRDVTAERRSHDDLQRRLAVEQTLTRVSQRFIDHSADDVEACIDDGLRDLGEHLGVDRVLLLMLDGDTMPVAHEYRDPDAGLPPITTAELPTLDLMPNLAAARDEGAPLVVDDLALATIAPAGQAVADRLAIRALLIVPLIRNEEAVGLIALAPSQPRPWNEIDVSALRRFAAIAVNGLERHEATRRRHELEARLAGLIESSWDEIIVLDEHARLTFANRQTERVIGWEPEDLVGRNALDLIHPDDLDTALASMGRVLSGDQGGRIIPLRLQHRDGHWVHVEIVGNNLMHEPAINGIVANVRDTTERRMIAEKLRETESLFEEVFRHGPIGLMLVTQSRSIFRVNPAICDILGYTADELCGRTITDITHPDDRVQTIEQHTAIHSGTADSYRYEKRYIRKDGTTVWCRVNVNVVRDADGTAAYSVGHIEDITESRRIAEQLEREARHDALTDLPSRRFLLERLERALDESRRGGHGQVAALFIDLDHFKQVNDSLGHAAGDELLASVARAIQGSLRGSDVAGRFGGDEFVVLCPALASPTDATVVADRIRRRLSAPFVVHDTEVFVGASIGIAIADHRSDAASLMAEADTAAYRAKERGRNRIEIFDRELRTAIAKRVEIATALRHAIDDEELVLHYQPLVDVDSSRLAGFEALVRWERPGVGLVSPADFLPVAEERGLIVPMGRWITEHACQRLATWNGAGLDTTMGINLSPRQLNSGHLVREVRAILDDTGVDPTSLYFEITENALVDDAETAIRRLSELRDLGVRLAIDDFGTGYSSLSYLRRLPVQVVKIDRSFILSLGVDREGSTIVASVINLAHALGMEIVAEGVESIEHVAALVTLGCDKMQGYWFSKPVPAEQATRLLTGGGTWLGDRWNESAA